jgi:hypothetical protein
MSLICRSVFCAIPAQAVFCARQGLGVLFMALWLGPHGFLPQHAAAPDIGREENTTAGSTFAVVSGPVTLCARALWTGCGNEIFVMFRQQRVRVGCGAGQLAGRA